MMYINANTDNAQASSSKSDKKQQKPLLTSRVINSLPVVRSVWGYGWRVYDEAKESTVFMKHGMERLEGVAQPLVNKYKAIDNFASNQVDRLGNLYDSGKSLASTENLLQTAAYPVGYAYGLTLGSMNALENRLEGTKIGETVERMYDLAGSLVDGVLPAEGKEVADKTMSVLRRKNPIRRIGTRMNLKAVRNLPANSFKYAWKLTRDVSRYSALKSVDYVLSYMWARANTSYAMSERVFNFLMKFELTRNAIQRPIPYLYSLSEQSEITKRVRHQSGAVAGYAMKMMLAQLDMLHTLVDGSLPHTSEAVERLSVNIYNLQQYMDSVKRSKQQKVVPYEEDELELNKKEKSQSDEPGKREDKLSLNSWIPARHVAEKVSSLATVVEEAVAPVKEAVKEAVAPVKEAVKEALASVKEEAVEETEEAKAKTIEQANKATPNNPYAALLISSGELKEEHHHHKRARKHAEDHQQEEEDKEAEEKKKQEEFNARVAERAAQEQLKWDREEKWAERAERRHEREVEVRRIEREAEHKRQIHEEERLQREKMLKKEMQHREKERALAEKKDQEEKEKAEEEKLQKDIAHLQRQQKERALNEKRHQVELAVKHAMEERERQEKKEAELEKERQEKREKLEVCAEMDREIAQENGEDTKAEEAEKVEEIKLQKAEEEFLAKKEATKEVEESQQEHAKEVKKEHHAIKQDKMLVEQVFGVKLVDERTNWTVASESDGPWETVSHKHAAHLHASDLQSKPVEDANHTPVDVEHNPYFLSKKETEESILSSSPSVGGASV